MRTITQEGAPAASRMTLASEPKSRDQDHDLFFDLEDFTSYGKLPSNFSNSRNDDVIVIAEADVPRRSTQQTINKPRTTERETSERGGGGAGEAQKKFGGAKAISSDQYFRNSGSDGDAVGFRKSKQ